MRSGDDGGHVEGRRGLDRGIDEAKHALAALAIAIERRSPLAAHTALARARTALDGAETASAVFALLQPAEHEHVRSRLGTLHASFAVLLDIWLRSLADNAHDWLGDPRATTRLDGPVLAGADLGAVDLAGANLVGSMLRDVHARDGRLDEIDANAARWTGCRFTASSFVAARFDGSSLDDCDFSWANLARAKWRGTNLLRCRFGGAMLFDCDFLAAIFSQCDLRGADLGTQTPTINCTGAYFYRCDLRESAWGDRDLSGVTFIECKMFGVRGQPRLGDVLVAEPDTSRAGDGTRCDPRDVFSAWGS